MKSNDKAFYIFMFFLIVFFAFFALYIIKSISQMPNHQELNEASIECYNSALSFLSENNVSTEYVFPKNIKCLENNFYLESELTGKYRVNDNESDRDIFFLNIRGGRAASGADGVNDVCLIIDGKKVISKIEQGRNLILTSPSGCAWKKKLP